MKNRICFLVIAMIITVVCHAQSARYAFIDAQVQSLSSVSIKLKTYADKKKESDTEAKIAAVNILLFDGIPGTPCSKALLPLNAKSDMNDYLHMVYHNRLNDFIHHYHMDSDFQKAASGEKSTMYSVVVDYAALKKSVSDVLSKQERNFSSSPNLSMQKKPTLMILPSDNWCSLRLYTTTYDNQGTKVKVPNYIQAFQDDQELGTVISKVGGVLTGLGYSIKDVEQELRALNQRQAEDNVTTSKNSGAVLAESPLDQLKKRAKADILIQIWWKVNKENNGKSVSFTLEAFDAYTSKRIGTSSGTGAASDEIIPVLLENAIQSHIAEFDEQMVRFYTDIAQNGREIVMNIKKWDDWENDLESDYDGATVLDIIEDWMHENTVNDSFNLSDASDNFAFFEQVRIPLTNVSGRPLDARGFVSGLQKHLKNNYDISSKLVIRGLGEANLILGEQ